MQFIRVGVGSPPIKNLNVILTLAFTSEVFYPLIMMNNILKLRRAALVAAFATFAFTGGLLADSEKKAPPGMILTWTGDPTTSIVIDWHRLAEDEDTPAFIQARQRGTNEWTPIEAERFPFPGSDRLIDRVSIMNLQPDTEYEFRGSPDEKTYWFRTMPATLDRPIVIAAGGDVRHRKEWMSAMNRAAMEHDPDLIVWGGDLAYCDGRISNAHLWYEFLDSKVETLVTPEGRVPPVVVGMGNHEIRRAYHRGRINSHEDRERLAPFFYALFAFPGDPGYGVLDFGNYMSIVMGDSDHSNPIEREQAVWMKETLSERSHVPHLIPVYHVPAYPSVRNFNDRVGRLVREHWVPLFEENGIRLVLEHHDHTYKRTVPIFEGAEDAERGVIYVGDGSWGVRTRGVHNVENTWYLEQAQSIRHALIITLHPDHKVVDAIDAESNVIDTVTIPAREVR